MRAPHAGPVLCILVLLLSTITMLPPPVHAGYDFMITVFVSQKTTYNIGETPLLFNRVQNTGTVTIEPYDLHAVYTVTAPSGTKIAAGEGWMSGWLDPGKEGLIQNTDKRWTIPDGAEAGSYSISVTIASYSTGVSRSATTSNAFSVNAPPPPDYRVYVEPTNVIVQPGEIASYTVTVEPLNGWTDPVQLSCSPVHISMTVQFNPTSVNPPSWTSKLTITTTSATPENTWTLTVTGTSGTRIHSFSGSSVTVKKTTTPDYQISITPASGVVTQGGSASFTVTATAYSGYNSEVTLSALATGSGLSLSFSGSQTAKVVPTAQVQLSLSASTDATTGRWYFVVYGKDSSGLYRQTSAFIQVNSNIQGITVSLLSTDKPSYNPTEQITFSFTVSNNGLVSVTLRPIVNVENVGTWQGSDMTLAAATSKPVSVPVTKTDGWLPGSKTWGVILIGPPPSYPNLIYSMGTTSSFNIAGNVYTITIKARTTSLTPITGTQIYLGSGNKYQRYVTSGSEGRVIITVPAVSTEYSLFAMMYVGGEPRPAPSATGYVFDHWEVNSGSAPVNLDSAATSVTVSGNCEWTAYFARLDVDLKLETPPEGSVTELPPTSVTAKVSIQLKQEDANGQKVKNAKGKTVYLRASLEGWAADGGLNEWYLPVSGTQSYTIGYGYYPFTWEQFGSLSPAPMPGTYSVNLVVFDGSTYSTSFPPTTGPIAVRRLNWAFGFNNDKSYTEIYGTSQGRVIHIHWRAADIPSAKKIQDLMKKAELIDWGFTITDLLMATTVARAALHKTVGKIAAGDLVGVLEQVVGDTVSGHDATISGGTYDIVIYQTPSQTDGGRFYETTLVGAQTQRGMDLLFTGVDVMLGLATVVSLVMAVPTAGASLLLIASVAGLVWTAANWNMNVPKALFLDNNNNPRFQNLPAYGIGGFQWPASLGSSAGMSSVTQTSSIRTSPVPTSGTQGGSQTTCVIDGATWTLVVTSAYAGYPKWGTDTDVNTGITAFYMDSPWGTSLYVERQFIVPSSSPKLSLTVWGNYDPVTVQIAVNGQAIDTFSPSQTQKGGALQTKQYDLSAWAGQTVTIRINQYSTGSTGTFGWYKNIVVSSGSSYGYAYGPDGAQFTGVTISSITPSSVTLAPSSTVTVTVNYRIENPPAQGQDMQLMLVYSWGGGWPPIKYVGITGGGAGQEGSASFTLQVPQKPRTYFAWIVIGLGSTFAAASLGFGLDLFSTSVPHVTLTVCTWSLLDGPTPDAPALASSSYRLYLAARGMDNGIWYRSMDSSGTWSGWSRLPGFTDTRPAVAVFNSRLYFFCKQLGANSIWYGYYPLSGGVVSGAFSGWYPLDGLTPSAVSLASSPDYLYLAARGMDGSIWHRRMSTAGAWSGWSRVLGFTDVSPAIAFFNNRLYLVCKQSGAQSIWYGYVDLSSYPSAWSGWSPLDGLTPDALTLASSSGCLYLVARSTDNSIWYRTMDSTGSWSGWSPASGYTLSPVAIAVFNGYMHLAARQAGTNNLWIYK